MDEKVYEIDCVLVHADKDGYYVREQYPTPEGDWYSVKTYLGKNAKEVEQAMSDYYDWNYRAWHGKMDAILKAQEEVRKLPDIR